MKFGKRPVREALGTILAHSIKASRSAEEIGTPYRIPKGTELTRRHLEDLIAVGHEVVTVAEIEAEDVQENEAALFLARALVPDEARQRVRISDAGAGRVNLYADCCGITCLDVACIEALNAVDPMITIATVPPWYRVDEGGMIATIKIISYAVASELLQAAAQKGGEAVKVLPPVFRTATLIETQVNEEMPSNKGRRAMAGRLHRMGLELTSRQIVPHREEDLSAALQKAPGEVLLVLTGSATSDARDVAPEALHLAGGRITRFGMPVDPGNLLFLGNLGEKPVIGLPGCARSPALNGADWVLERVLCGLDLTGGDIAAMGVGGLLKEIPTRPMPRDS
ncbi:molybdopterin biosynthesis protein [Roseobacter sp. SK209-2-6]|uniref:molybdopterin-binding protein n=1 Tax=Roseobacter sp. SK209-2-6 TaxID=388739 RepID=UPI0000F3CFD2|nr:molybdopterin-binding protein [Roseobacter sp. SK209-2-6]EBA15298.1 molybdopterin biosynthesis protein [Roseobacter sp. SK209-2-6]